MDTIILIFSGLPDPEKKYISDNKHIEYDYQLMLLVLNRMFSVSFSLRSI